MDLKSGIDQFRQLPQATQIAFIVFALVMIILLIIFPSAGTNLITFLVALKMLRT